MRCSTSKTQNYYCSIVFSSTTPIGIITGLGVSAVISGGFFAEFTKAIAAGTFLYVGLVEVIMEEFGGHDAPTQNHHPEEAEAEPEPEPEVDQPFTSRKYTQLKKIGKILSTKYTSWLKFGLIVLGVVLMSLVSAKDGHSQETVVSEANITLII